MKDARFKVKRSDGWLWCIPLNQAAIAIIHGKKAAIYPISETQRRAEIADILRRTNNFKPPQ